MSKKDELIHEDPLKSKLPEAGVKKYRRGGVKYFSSFPTISSLFYSPLKLGIVISECLGKATRPSLTRCSSGG